MRSKSSALGLRAGARGGACRAVPLEAGRAVPGEPRRGGLGSRLHCPRPCYINATAVPCSAGFMPMPCHAVLCCALPAVLQASGFCYINDIVLAILELLKVHQR